MNRLTIVSILVAATLVLGACGPTPVATEEVATATEGSQETAEAPTSTPTPTETLVPTITPTPTASNTPTPTAVNEYTMVEGTVQRVISSHNFVVLVEATSGDQNLVGATINVHSTDNNQTQGMVVGSRVQMHGPYDNEGHTHLAIGNWVPDFVTTAGEFTFLP